MAEIPEIIVACGPLCMYEGVGRREEEAQKAKKKWKQNRKNTPHRDGCTSQEHRSQQQQLLKAKLFHLEKCKQQNK